MSRTTKVIALLLALLTMLPACGAGETETKTDASQNTAVAETSETEYAPAIPNVTYSGENFNVLYRNGAGSYNITDIIAEELTGEIVNDSVYNRNLALEEKFKISLVGIANADPHSYADKEIMAGITSFDVMADCMNATFTFATRNALIDWNTLTYVDASKPWWDSNAAEKLSVANKLYMMVGDVSMHASSLARYLYFNKDMARNFNLEMPYSKVQEGTWTLDEFSTMVTTVSVDLDGDGKMTGSDQFGFLKERTDHFLTGCGILFTEKDETDMPVISCINERTVDVIAAVKAIFDDKTYSLSYEQAAQGQDTSAHAHIFNFGRSLFATDHFLFVQNGANVAYQFSEMESEYGILPNPKFNAEQENYFHLMDAFATAWSIPTTVENLEKVDIIMEYWAYLSSGSLVDAFYETTIKKKRLNAPEDATMLDIIRSSIQYEISTITNIGVMDVINGAYSNGNLMSQYASKQRMIEANLASLLETFTEQ